MTHCFPFCCQWHLGIMIGGQINCLIMQIIPRGLQYECAMQSTSEIFSRSFSNSLHHSKYFKARLSEKLCFLLIRVLIPIENITNYHCKNFTL